MECSPAYATTEFKTKLAGLYIEHITCIIYYTIRSTVEPVYDTTGPETPLPPPATTEYETIVS